MTHKIRVSWPESHLCSNAGNLGYTSGVLEQGLVTGQPATTFTAISDDDVEKKTNLVVWRWRPVFLIDTDIRCQSAFIKIDASLHNLKEDENIPLNLFFWKCAKHRFRWIELKCLFGYYAQFCQEINTVCDACGLFAVKKQHQIDESFLVLVATSFQTASSLAG